MRCGRASGIDILSLDDLERISDIALTVLQQASAWQQQAIKARDQWVFNLGRSGEVAAIFLKLLLN